MNTNFPLFSDVDSRNDIFRSIENGLVLQPGDTFRHLTAFPLGLWHDFEGVAEDCATLFRAELRQWVRGQSCGPDVIEFLEVAPIHFSTVFRRELRRAISPRMQQIDNAFLGIVLKQRTEPPDVYTLPDMDSLYRAVLVECHSTARVRHQNDFESGLAQVRASESELKKTGEVE